MKKKKGKRIPTKRTVHERTRDQEVGKLEPRGPTAGGE